MWDYIHTSMTQVSYRGVSIPSDLVEKIESIISKGNLGYKTVGEFVKDAVRQHIFRVNHNNNIGGGNGSSKDD